MKLTGTETIGNNGRRHSVTQGIDGMVSGGFRYAATPGSAHSRHSVTHTSSRNHVRRLLSLGGRILTLGSRHLPLAIFLLSLGTCCPAFAFDIPAGDRKGSVVGVEVQDVKRENGQLVTDLMFDFSNVSLKGNTETVLTPMWVNGTDTVRLEPLIVAGRNRWYWLQRNKKDLNTPIYKGFNSKLEGVLSIMRTPYQDWMEAATFTIETQTRGCANCIKKNEPVEFYSLAQTDFTTRTFTPEFIYVTPYVESPKIRSISARAYVDFPVNKIEIYPTYRNNAYELGKIISTIDSVKNDPDILVRSLHISGTASPEGSYENNVYLAKNRTEALKNYVQRLYNFPPGFITTSYQPVDWVGLRDYLTGVQNAQYRVVGAGSADNSRQYATAIPNPNLPNAKGILDIVNSDIPDYQRNEKIKTTYPQEYAWLLANVYPSLRHSDYTIQFEVRSFTTVDEIVEVMQTAPQKLSLNELFKAADAQPVGSELFTESFEIAVRLFPQDETANLNAATNALQRNDLTAAQRYLSRAGDSPEARFTMGLLKYQQGAVDEAISIMEELAKGQGDLAAKAQIAASAMTEVKTHRQGFTRLDAQGK